MQKTKTSPWTWIPTLYFAEGLPYVVVMTLSVIMYKRLGVSNSDIALYTSWLYLPWVIKPFWSPVVDLLKTKRWWIIVMQLLIGAGLGGVALTIPMPGFFQYTMLFFWLLAFSSATHDIAADGFYMLGLKEHEQSYFVGIRSTFYRLAMITGQGLLIILAGYIESNTGLEPIEFTVTAQENVISNQQDVANPNRDFILSSKDYIFDLNGLAKDSASALKSWVKEQNQMHHFVPAELNNVESPSLWSKHVSIPLQSYLKEHFGKSAQTEAVAKEGSIAKIGIALSHQPEKGEDVVLNIDRLKGDKDLKLIGNQRFVFNENNWNQTAWVMVQADHKLDRVAQASFKGTSGNIPLAWLSTFIVLTALFIIFSFYHKFRLPKPSEDKTSKQSGHFWKEFGATYASFFRKPNIALAIVFMMVFRLGESQLVKIASLFLLDSKASGGLGLTTGSVGVIYGTIGILFLTLGGILGGWLVSKNGLKYWLWPMAFAMNLPNLAYVYLAYFLPDSFSVIAACVAIEQFGYGFGFTAFMMYLIYFSDGKNKTAHYAICTGLMALGMMIPGMLSGWLQEIIGYQKFFIWVMICTIPGFWVIKYLKIDSTFGKKQQ